MALSDEHGDLSVLTPPVPNGPEASAAPSPVPAATAAEVPLPSKAQLVTEFEGRRPAEWGLAVTGVVTRSPGSHTVLTFDACGGPGGSGVDQELLATLRRLNIPATLFVNARWIQSNRQVAAELAHDPLFELANHGWQHRPLSVTGKSAYGIPGTRNVADVYDELTGCADVFREVTGHRPRFFRSGTAYFDEVAAAVSRRLGMLPVNFSINADAGATLAPAAVASAVATARPGDIVIAHFNKPGGGTAAGFRQALPQLKGGGTRFARLGDVLPAL
ncbi:polysaccharide deacetylase family protein [Pseudarthrobacter sp. AL07]|uniref:polysaccharide deacetylase family protein n=1 Tax=Pseudarthrobacter sp. AL20 TaxID=3042239 RepID=UPI00249C5883|nr:polysaccharide deacetylase family protein [Pseudarthrobacter sp. AL20]MDI3195049.1 polysaccharide deacetylase family protein [Pseudarthrobacter sp. AL20]MDI3209079.1 polysaccharide deacetylase family protein [Pseudarthrobacter sp. AL07]